MGTVDYKNIIKSAVRKAAFAHLLELQQGHSKYKTVEHSSYIYLFRLNKKYKKGKIEKKWKKQRLSHTHHRSELNSL